MEYIYYILHIIEYTLFIYLGFSAVYILVFALAGKFRAKLKIKQMKQDKFRKFAVLIPGYKEDNVIYEVAIEALKQDYPNDYFDVVIIADSFLPETIEKLKTLPIILIEVAFEKSTKSKALNKAMETIGNNYDVALILDADNVMENSFVRKINNAFNNGFEIVQGHRIAKNTNTSFAVLDAISEELNNHIFRQGHRALGLSSALIGSGMAFEYNMFKTRMSEIKAIGGFDKELELTLLRDKKKIEYVEDALVYDEKVQKVEVFENQRKRWLSAQFVYFGRFFVSGVQHLLFKGNIDFFDKVIQMISPPRILLIGITAIMALFVFVIHLCAPFTEIISIYYSYWLFIFLAVVLAFILSIPSKFYNRQTLNALLTLPKAFASMFLSLFKLKGANKKFIHTQHGTEL
jgi:cellulose synthase/poly-beta-1,6-N-acetylglucosamine synthase-like glycosyltransferase